MSRRPVGNTSKQPYFHLSACRRFSRASIQSAIQGKWVFKTRIEDCAKPQAPGVSQAALLSGRYGSFHSNVIGATAGEVPFVLDGLVGNAAQFDPLVHHVDTGGVSDHVFALFHLLGLSFAPRLRDFPDRRLACFGRPGRWKELAPLMGKPINEEVVLEHWNDALRLTASIKTVSVTPSAMLRKLGAYRQQNRLYLALGEIGRIERTLSRPRAASPGS